MLLVVHARRIAEAQHVNASVGKFFRNPVYSHVALGAHKHLAFAAQGLVYGFNESCGFSGARRAVHNGHVFGI